MGQHGSHDIGIMYLLAAGLKTLHQLNKLPGYSCGIICHLKLLFQIAYPLYYYIRCWRLCKGLWSGTCSGKLPQYLTADP